MEQDFSATINEDSPRAADWLKVLGSREVAITSPQPVLASAPGIEAALFYQLDLSALTAEQRARLIAHLAERFHVPLAEVKRDLNQVGCPLLAEDLIVAVSQPWTWL